MLTLTRLLGLAAAVAAGLWLLINSDRIGTLKAVGLTLLLFVALGPVVQPWYLSWGLILLAPVALGRLRSLIIGLSMVTAFIELPSGKQLLNSLIHGDPLLIVLTLLWLLVVLTVPLASWERREAVGVAPASERTSEEASGEIEPSRSGPGFQPARAAPVTAA
jgi:alpha-1,6-mannosyltransferase